MVQSIQERFEWQVSFLIVSYKFVHEVLGMLRKSEYKAIETMGVKVNNGSFQLYYNTEFVNSLNDNEMTYVFVHEVLHLMLHHCTRRQPSKDKKLHRIWNLATDAAVNQLIQEVPGRCSIPRDKKGKVIGIHVSELKKQKEFKDIKDKQSSEWYYDYFLKKNKENQDAGGPGIFGGDDDGEFTLDDHGGWAEDGDEIADEIISAKVRHIDQNEMWGSLSADAKELILAAQVKRINWTQYIRTWFGNHAWKDRSNTRKRPNRRTGYMHPGTRKQYVDRWLIAVDTSGSIDSDLLAMFGGVVNQLVDVLPIDFMQFDANVTAQPKPFERKMLQIAFTGRGGTDFQPVMDIVDKQHYKGVMILTDGCAGVPTQPKARVLWVLPEGDKPPVEWGDRIHLSRFI